MIFTRRKFIIASAAVAVTSITAFALPSTEEPEPIERASVTAKLTHPIVTANPEATVEFPREAVTSLPAPEPEPEPEPEPTPEPEPVATTPAAPAPGVSAPAQAPATSPLSTLAPVPSSSGSVAESKEFARSLLASKGFGEAEFVCLDNLWERESNWNHTADNPYSDAYGIPQSLPGEKMATFGDDWATNPQTQIKWGISYIEGRYGSPCNAWGHSESVGWY